MSISSRTLIKWRIFIDAGAKLNPSKNGYFLLYEYGDHHFAENGAFVEQQKNQQRSMISFLVASHADTLRASFPRGGGTRDEALRVFA